MFVISYFSYVLLLLIKGVKFLFCKLQEARMNLDKIVITIIVIIIIVVFVVVVVVVKVITVLLCKQNIFSSGVAFIYQSN